MLPSFLCIGAQKAGTSWLFAQLHSHPGIWVPPIKEVHYFNHLFVPENRKWTKWHIRHATGQALKNYVTRNEDIHFPYVQYLVDLGSRDLFTEAWYRRVFELPAANNRLVGDLTPEYSTIPEAGIRYLRSLLGGVKIIYLIRDPLSRALSQLRMNISRQVKGAMSDTDWLHMADQWDIYNRGDYRSYVPRWKAFFAPEDILFLPYGRVARDPVGLMREVEAFLGLAAHDYPRVAERVHKTRSLAVPDSIVRRVAERLDGQADFIAAEFGPEFARLMS
jgi:Sulfotransferase family